LFSLLRLKQGGTLMVTHIAAHGNRVNPFMRKNWRVMLGLWVGAGLGHAALLPGQTVFIKSVTSEPVSHIASTSTSDKEWMRMASALT